MNILITYDVDTTDKHGAKRLRHVAKTCKDFGQRVQNSVFECEITDAQLCTLKDKLKNIVESTKDSIRIYHLSNNAKSKTCVIGCETAYDVTGPIII